MDRFFGCYKWARELRHKIMRESGLPLSFGLSANKTVAKIATGEAKPSGELHVQRPRIPLFLAPLSIRKIPMIGDKTFRMLRAMGVDTISTLRQMPPDLLERVMGKNGQEIWRRANGIDNTPVEPYWEQKSVSTERTFEQDSTDVRMMRALLAGMVEKLCYELRSQQKLTSCVIIKLRYANFDTHTLQRRIPYTSFDHTLIAVAGELFEKLYNRRMLIRLLGIRFTHLVQGTQQLNLFEDTPEMVNLYRAVDGLKRRFGKNAVVRAVSI